MKTSVKKEIEGPLEISVVIPLYNEEKGLEELYVELKDVLVKIGKPYEIIFVDDGSEDKSFEILKKLHQDNSSLKVVRFRKNFGKTSALDAGFSLAKGKVVITLDADLQDNPEEIPLFLAEIKKGNQVVVGWRSNRQDTFSKRTYSKIFNKVTSFLTGLKLNDFNCPFKAFKQEVVKNLNIYGELHRFIPILAATRGYKVTEIQVVNRSRKFGESKYGIERLWRGFFDAVTVLFIGKYSEKPLHFFGGLSLVLFFLGIFINLFIILRKFFYGQLFAESMGLLTLGVIVLSAAFNLFAVGLLLEFILNKDLAKKRTHSIENILGK